MVLQLELRQDHFLTVVFDHERQLVLRVPRLIDASEEVEAQSVVVVREDMGQKSPRISSERVC